MDLPWDVNDEEYQQERHGDGIVNRNTITPVSNGAERPNGWKRWRRSEEGV